MRGFELRARRALFARNIVVAVRYSKTQNLPMERDLLSILYKIQRLTEAGDERTLKYLDDKLQPFVTREIEAMEIRNELHADLKDGNLSGEERVELIEKLRELRPFAPPPDLCGCANTLAT